jgi:hypothetical protein
MLKIFFEVYTSKMYQRKETVNIYGLQPWMMYRTKSYYPLSNFTGHA